MTHKEIKKCKQRIAALEDLLQHEKSRLYENKSIATRLHDVATEYTKYAERREGEYYGTAYQRGIELIAKLKPTASGFQDFYIHDALSYEVANEIILAACKNLEDNTIKELITWK